MASHGRVVVTHAIDLEFVCGGIGVASSHVAVLEGLELLLGAQFVGLSPSKFPEQGEMGQHCYHFKVIEPAI